MTSAGSVTRGLGLALLLLASCSRPSAPPKGRLVVAVTVDWEGAYLSEAGLDALDALRARLPAGAPLTHFVSAAYFTKATLDPAAAASLDTAIRDGDEAALHLHAWASLARTAELAPRLSPSFLTGTDKVLEFPDGDVGFDVDLDVYDGTALRALVRTSKQLLVDAGLPVSTSFRAGGYLATPKVLQAIRAEGFTQDSSAADHRQFGGPQDKVLRERIGEVWPAITSRTQPYEIRTPAGALLELPIGAVADYVSTADLVAVIEAHHAALRAAPGRDVVLVLALHQENAEEFAPRIGDALDAVRGKPGVLDAIQFVTIEQAAARVRGAQSPSPTSPTPADTARGSSASTGAPSEDALSGQCRFATLGLPTEGA